jgi:hypothetical protein
MNRLCQQLPVLMQNEQFVISGANLFSTLEARKFYLPPLSSPLVGLTLSIPMHSFLYSPFPSLPLINDGAGVYIWEAF